MPACTPLSTANPGCSMSMPSAYVPARRRSENSAMNFKRMASRRSLVGGAFETAELDAKRAIDQATRLAAVILMQQGDRNCLVRKCNLLFEV